VSHVLAKPTRAEAELVSLGIELAADAVELVITDGVNQAMTIVNARQ
jgi:peptidyl-tRNA hydrolase